MKLLSRVQTKDSQAKEQTLKILRAQETEAIASKANANLARAEADFNATLARNRAKWALEEEEHAERLKGMTVEIEALERRKKQALIPIEMYKKEADAIMEAVTYQAQQVKDKEEQIEYLQEKLEEKLTNVADRENLVAIEENRQKIALLGIQSQQEQIKKQAEELSKQMLMFHEKQKHEEDSLLERKKEVTLAETSFRAKTEKYSRDLEALRVAQVQVKDQRETLERALKNSPYIKKSNLI